MGIGGRESRIDDHTQLIRLGRDEYRYIEGDRSLILQIDMLKGIPNRLIYSSTIEHWMPPHQNKAISEEDRRRIATKIAGFLTNQGFSVKVE
jgi:hypothetical protein